MKNAVPLNTIAKIYHITVSELLFAVQARCIEVVWIENEAYANASDFEFLNTSDEIFINTEPQSALSNDKVNHEFS
ncbi:MAG: hypothetical protein O3C44_02570 [Proteobacteria bacterium]|jgi:hypothetical protein|nr:hypothetical protein [Pseudomonadota bacterium]